MATDADWDAYRTAVVDLDPPWVPGLRLVPEAPGTTGAWPAQLDSPVFIITAWNPDSVRFDEASNRARHDALVADLARRDVEHWPAVGRDTIAVHHEEGVAAVGITEEAALALGRAHGQAAIYVWTPEAWTVASCTDDRRIILGWRIEVRGGTT
jgi:Protein of unknown function (DUF3293)